MKRIDVSAEKYYHYENDIQVINLKNYATEFMVQETEKSKFGAKTMKIMNDSQISSISNQFLEKVMDVTVQRTSDWQEFQVRTHLGDMLRCGSMVEGFDLTTLNNSYDIRVSETPDVILVRRKFDKGEKRRIWKLKKL